MIIRKWKIIFAILMSVVLALLLAVPAMGDMPEPATMDFPASSYVVPMDGKQAALSSTDTTVYGFIWKVLEDGGTIYRIIEPPDINLQTDAYPGGTVYSGGVIVILAGDAAIVAGAQAAFPTVTVHSLTVGFTSNKVFPVSEPTQILVVQGIWGHTEDDLDAMGVPYDLKTRSEVEANPSLLFDYDVVVVDCPGWIGGVPTDVGTALEGFATGGGELIFTDIALLNLESVFPGYVSVVTNEDGVWDTTISNPPITGFTAEYPSQYPADFPTSIKIYTMGGGKIVDNVLNTSEVRVWMDSSEYGSAGVYRVLGFYFPYGDGVVEGMAYHPQEQIESITGDPDSFVAGTVFVGNKMVFSPPPVMIEKGYTYTNVCFEKDNDHDGYFNEDPVDLIDNDGDGMIDEDAVDCPSGTFLGDPLPNDAEGTFTVQAVIQPKTGKVSSYNPGQYYAVSTVNVLSDVDMLTIEEDFDDCIDTKISALSPENGGGAVVVVKVAPGDDVAYQILDAESAEVSIVDNVATVELGAQEAGTTILVYVKFAPGMKGQSIWIDDECVNTNSAWVVEDPGEGDIISASATLAVIH